MTTAYAARTPPKSLGRRLVAGPGGCEQPPVGAVARCSEESRLGAGRHTGNLPQSALARNYCGPLLRRCGRRHRVDLGKASGSGGCVPLGRHGYTADGARRPCAAPSRTSARRDFAVFFGTPRPGSSWSSTITLFVLRRSRTVRAVGMEHLRDPSRHVVPPRSPARSRVPISSFCLSSRSGRPSSGRPAQGQLVVDLVQFVREALKLCQSLSPHFGSLRVAGCDRPGRISSSSSMFSSARTDDWPGLQNSTS